MAELYTLDNADVQTWPDQYDGPPFHALLCDAPYEIEFMGKGWDGSGVAFDPATWAGLARHLLPGAFLFVFAGTLNDDLISVAMRQAGLRKYHRGAAWSYGCLSEDTEILTRNGWEPYHKAIVGTDVLCYNTHCDALEWHGVQELQVYEYDETAYRILSEDTDQIVSRNHRCLVERGGRYVFRYAETLSAVEQVPVLSGVLSVREGLHAQELPRRRQEDLFAGVCAGGDTGAAPGQAAIGAQGRNHHLSRVWYAGVEASGMAASNQNALLLGLVSEQGGTLCSAAPACRQQQGQEEPREGARGRGKSRLEGWRNLLQDARELYGRQVRALPGSVFGHGPQGWLCDGASASGRAGHWAPLATFRSGASHRSRPVEQLTRQPAAVCIEPRSQAVRASRVAASSLAVVTPIHYTGKVWCVRVPTGAFVARRNGKVFITGNSGFPKATNPAEKYVARRLADWLRDHPAETAELRAAAQATRDAETTEARNAARAAYQRTKQRLAEAAGLTRVAGKRRHAPKFDAAGHGYREKDNGFNSKERETFDVVEYLDPIAAALAGHRYGLQAIKPALEPILVFQKSHDGAPVEGIATTGAGALWVDGGRVGTAEDMNPRDFDDSRRTSPKFSGMFNGGREGLYLDRRGTVPPGRWPANLWLVHSPACAPDACAPDCPARRIGEQSGESVSKASMRGVGLTRSAVYGAAREDFDTLRGHADTGTAARFFHQSDWMYERLEQADSVFYCAKASRAEREAGLDPDQIELLRLCGLDLDDFEAGTVDDGRETPIDNPYQRGETERLNPHTTVKPLALTRHLATLLLPPERYGPRRLLVPFAGVASEMCGALLAGWEHVHGIELTPEYIPVARARLAYWQARRHEFADGRPVAVSAPRKAPAGQRSIFDLPESLAAD